MRKTTLTGGLLCCALLSGCAAMSEEACKVGDWSQAGFTDGKNGRQSEYLYRRVESCNKYGIPFTDDQRAAWFSGYDQGRISFCTPWQAYSLGSQNAADPNICGYDPQVEAQFRTNYARGTKVYSAREEVRKLEDRLSSYESELAQGTRNSGDMTRPMNRGERANWERKINQTRDELWQAKDKLSRMELEYEPL